VVAFAVSFPSVSSFAVLLYCSSFSDILLSVSISSVPFWQSSFQAELAASMAMLMQWCTRLPAAHSLG